MARLAAQRIAAALLALTGVVHLVLAPRYLRDVPYLGVLFVLAGLAALTLGAELWRTGDRTVWLCGAVLCLGLVVGLLLARTVGLPAFSKDSWGAGGVLGLMVEGGYLLTALVSLREPGPRPASATPSISRSARTDLARGAPLRRS
jgi:drug/metabolite transporter (DMT)-like permease